MADGKSDDTSLSRRSFGSLAAGTTLAAGTPLVAEAQTAQVVRRWVSDNPAAEVGVVEIVPPGYTTYYLAGSPASPLDPNAPMGSPGRWGNTAQQTDSSLNKIQATLTKLGLTFGDVVKAIVFIAGDPAKGGDIDFAAMNAEWAKRFGTTPLPPRPPRSTIKVGLATPGQLIEIEMIAVKKVG
jgi:enamine deaminase RidA (YjgF/YER057c/UK114 family)